MRIRTKEHKEKEKKIGTILKETRKNEKENRKTAVYKKNGLACGVREK